MSELNRREFLGTTAAAAAMFGAAAHVGAAGEQKRDTPIRLAVMGVHGRGKDLISQFITLPNVEIAYVCDPDDVVIPPAVKVIADRKGAEPKVQKDFRVALDDPQVDALVCAAPDHWHALATVLACQAGKDVYVEKPVSHNVVEGRRMVEAARKHGRVVQAGTQRRSGCDYRDAVEFIRGGGLGGVHFVRCWIASVRPNIGHESGAEPPPNLDFNLWAGPAPADTYKKNLVHYHWHWRWAYGTGECGNNGAHALDVARWGLGVESPSSVCCGGGKYSFDDDQETPDTQLATFDFGDAAIHWEHRTWSPSGIDDETFGVTFYGTEGTLACHAAGWSLYNGNKLIKTREPDKGRDLAHLQNFLDCIVSRETPNADIEIGHKSAVLCHLANIAWRTRSVVSFDGATESILDLKGETPSGDVEPRSLLGREYRKGFELPQVV